MYEQEGEADRQGNLDFIVLWPHRTEATAWSLFVSWKCYSRFAAYGDTLLRHIHSQSTFDFQICLSSCLLRFQRVFDCLEIKTIHFPTSWKLSKIPQLLSPPFFFFSSPAERTRQRLHLHRDCSGKQLHGASERQVRGLVHGFHAQGPSKEGLQDQAAPEGGPLHEASTQGALAEREETVWCPSSRCPSAAFEQAD